MAYVMLSRSECLEDIYITGKLDIEQIRCSEMALSESTRLEDRFNNRLIKIQKKKSFVISFLNCNRLMPHIEDICKDHMLIDSDIFALAETWLKPGELAPINGFTHVYENVRDGQGLVSYQKQTLMYKSKSYSSEKISAILIVANNLTFIFLYLSKNYSWEELKIILAEWINLNDEVAIMGDMNWNFEKSSCKMKEYLNENDFNQLISVPTHDEGGLIDHLYVNSKLQRRNIFFSTKCRYYTDHDLVQLSIDGIK